MIDDLNFLLFFLFAFCFLLILPLFSEPTPIKKKKTPMTLVPSKIPPNSQSNLTSNTITTTSKDPSKTQTGESSISIALPETSNTSHSNQALKSPHESKSMNEIVIPKETTHPSNQQQISSTSSSSSNQQERERISTQDKKDHPQLVLEEMNHEKIENSNKNEMMQQKPELIESSSVSYPAPHENINPTSPKKISIQIKSPKKKNKPARMNIPFNNSNNNNNNHSNDHSNFHEKTPIENNQIQKQQEMQENEKKISFKTNMKEKNTHSDINSDNNTNNSNNNISINYINNYNNLDNHSDQLYISNLHYSIDKEELHNLFKQYGAYDVKILKRRNGSSKGVAFIWFSCKEDQLRAMEAMNGTKIKGRALKVEIARSKRNPLDPNDDDSNDFEENIYIKPNPIVKKTQIEDSDNVSTTILTINDPSKPKNNSVKQITIRKNPRNMEENKQNQQKQQQQQNQSQNQPQIQNQPQPIPQQQQQEKPSNSFQPVPKNGFESYSKSNDSLRVNEERVYNEENSSKNVPSVSPLSVSNPSLTVNNQHLPNLSVHPMNNPNTNPSLFDFQMNNNLENAKSNFNNQMSQFMQQNPLFFNSQNQQIYKQMYFQNSASSPPLSFNPPPNSSPNPMVHPSNNYQYSNLLFSGNNNSGNTGGIEHSSLSNLSVNLNKNNHSNVPPKPSPNNSLNSNNWFIPNIDNGLNKPNNNSNNNQNIQNNQNNNPNASFLPKIRTNLGSLAPIGSHHFPQPSPQPPLYFNNNHPSNLQQQTPPFSWQQYPNNNNPNNFQDQRFNPQMHPNVNPNLSPYPNFLNFPGSNESQF